MILLKFQNVLFSKTTVPHHNSVKLSAPIQTYTKS